MERVGAALLGQPADRRPVCALLSLYGARLTGCPLPRYYADPVAYAAGQAAVLEVFEPDVLVAPFLAAAVAEAFGGTVRYYEAHPPNVVRPAVASAGEFAGLRIPSADTDGRLAYLRDAVALLRERVGPDVPIAAALPGPADMCPLAVGMEAWLDALVFDPDLAHRVLCRMIPFTAGLANAMLAAGATFAVFTGGLTGPPLVPPAIAREVTRPAFAGCARLVNAPVLFHHAGASIGPGLAALAEALPEVAGFAVDRADGLAAAREAIGPGRILMGNVDGPTLDHRSAGEVGDECRSILAAHGDDLRFVLATSGADVPLTTAPETIRALTWAPRGGREA